MVAECVQAGRGTSPGERAGRTMTRQGVAAAVAVLGLAMGTGMMEPAGARAQEAEVAATASAGTSAPTAAQAGDATARGPVTNLPLPRFVSLKTSEGNARRGPGLGHRIDWVFTRAGMPLRLTAEHENWRRVEDAEGQGGWVHYALLSGVRSVLVTEDMAELRARPLPEAPVVVQVERGVVARLLECQGGWCRISAAGNRGWLPERAIWGVAPGERVE